MSQTIRRMKSRGMRVLVTFSMPLETPAAMMEVVSASTASCQKRGSQVPPARAPKVSGVSFAPVKKAPKDLKT